MTGLLYRWVEGVLLLSVIIKHQITFLFQSFTIWIIIVLTKERIYLIEVWGIGWNGFAWKGDAELCDLTLTSFRTVHVHVMTRKAWTNLCFSLVVSYCTVEVALRV